MKLLKEYAKAFGFKMPPGLLEKEDLIQLILNTKLSSDNTTLYRMNRSAGLATGASSGVPSVPSTTAASASRPANRAPPASATTSSAPQSTPHAPANQQEPPASRQEAQSPLSFLTSAFLDIGKGFNELGGALGGAGKEVSSAFADVSKDISEGFKGFGDSILRAGLGQQNASDMQSPQAEQPSPAPSPDRHNAYPEARHAPTVGSSYESDPPTITTLVTTKMDLNSLTTKTLKRILLRERVSTVDINDREEMLHRVQILVDNVGKEMAGSINDDNMCKICCERVINVVILECGHLATCLECAETLQKSTHECPICRSRITRIIHVFR